MDKAMTPPGRSRKPGARSHTPAVPCRARPACAPKTGVHLFYRERQRIRWRSSTGSLFSTAGSP